MFDEVKWTATIMLLGTAVKMLYVQIHTLLAHGPVSLDLIVSLPF